MPGNALPHKAQQITASKLKTAPLVSRRVFRSSMCFSPVCRISKSAKAAEISAACLFILIFCVEIEARELLRRGPYLRHSPERRADTDVRVQNNIAGDTAIVYPFTPHISSFYGCASFFSRIFSYKSVESSGSYSYARASAGYIGRYRNRRPSECFPFGK